MQIPNENAEQHLAAALVSRIHQGDRDAETALIETYGNGLRYQLRRLSNDRALSEDLFQDTFKVVLEKVRDGLVREPEKLARFIRKTAQNLYIADYRKKARRSAATHPVKDSVSIDRSEDAHTRMEREQEAKVVRQVIRQMRTERDRHMLFRFYVAQEDKETICADLGIDPQIFNRLLSRARKRFKELWLAHTANLQNMLQHLLLLLQPW